MTDDDHVRVEQFANLTMLSTTSPKATWPAAGMPLLVIMSSASFKTARAVLSTVLYASSDTMPALHAFADAESATASA